MDYKIFIIVLISCTIDEATSKLFTFEIENFAPSAMRMPRSGASGNFTVLFNAGDLVHIEFCLRVVSSVSVRNVIYSNDGPGDAIAATIDGENIGSLRTPRFERGGDGWNVFRSSGPLDGKLELGVGRHVLTITATDADRWGVEIDNVLFNVDDNHLEYKDMLCNLYCFDVKYDDVPRQDSVPSGKFVQKSTSTQCSEQDNIKVEIYHDTATHFEIVANLPKYVSFANNRDPNYDHCILGSPYWLFANQTISPVEADLRNGEATLRFSGSHYRTMVTVRFDLRKLTPTREIDEKLSSSVLFVKLRNMPRENVKVKPEYLKNGAWIALNEIEFTPFDNQHAWVVQERTWNTLGENEVRLSIEPGKQQVILDTIKLERQYIADSTVELYADTDVVFQGVRLGFWQHWKDHPNSMTVKVQVTGATEYYKIDSLRVYVNVPWTGGYSQVLVMFQDGRMRLQAITPHGLDYIPFGASVNIGQPTSTATERPYSPVKKVDIDPKGLRMVVTYANGNSALFILETTFTQTKLIVKDAFFRKSRSAFPIMTFQSMWIHDGNADTDHVTINGDISRHITSNWKELYGISAVFFKKCISQHNTQGPDIRINFLS